MAAPPSHCQQHPAEVQPVVKQSVQALRVQHLDQDRACTPGVPQLSLPPRTITPHDYACSKTGYHGIIQEGLFGVQLC